MFKPLTASRSSPKDRGGNTCLAVTEESPKRRTKTYSKIEHHDYTRQFEYKTIVLLFGKEELPKAEEFEAHIKWLRSPTRGELKTYSKIERNDYTTQFEYKTIVLLFGKEELPKAEEFEAHIKWLTR